MLQPGRKYTAGTGYRYGFNGKENDNEVKGDGNQIDYGMRVHDPRVGRFLSVDPLTRNFPWYTPYQFAGNTPIQAIDLDGEEPKIIISNIPTGYTMIKVYGSTSRGIYPNERIAVPTYQAKLIDISNPGKTLATFNVTRDSWYSRGAKTETYKTTKTVTTYSNWDIFHWFPKSKQVEETHVKTTYYLTNRAFEPADGSKNLYAGIRQTMPHNTDLKGFELRQNGSNSIPAVPFSKEMNTYLDGQPIDDARTNLGRAGGINFHIGGFYYNSGKNMNRLAGSYGCFMFTPNTSTLSTPGQAENYFNALPNLPTSNGDYNQLLKQINDLRQKYGGQLFIEIQKRENYDKTKNVTTTTTNTN